MKAANCIARDSLFAGLPVTVVTVGRETREIKSGLADAAALLAAGVKADTRIMPGQPDVELGEMVEGGGPGLLVTGACGHSRIRGLVIGSTTTETMRSCKAPVLLLG